MAWNIPGGSNKDGRNPVRGGAGGVFDRLVDPLRGLFGGGGVVRWIGLLVALWLVFNCFVLITEQQRGVVLRFGQFDRVLQPGPHFKWPWPVEQAIKVNATQSQAFNDTVPVLTRDGLGLEALGQALGARLGLRRVQGELRLPPAAGRLRARLHELDAVRGEEHDEDGWRLQLDLAEADALRVASQPWGEPVRALLVDRPDPDR